LHPLKGTHAYHWRWRFPFSLRWLTTNCRASSRIGSDQLADLIPAAPHAPLSAILGLMGENFRHAIARLVMRPRSWGKTIATGIVFGVALKFVMKAMVMPLFGAPPINQAYHFVTGNPAVIPMMIYTMIVIAGFGEETFYRGWMFERFGKLLGQSLFAKIAIVLITSILFASLHYPEQGIPGAEQALMTGLIFGSIFAITGQIFMLMIAHAAFDLTALWMIYYGLETRIAHLIFH
jgi:membrane protease YdiL (CAAX protease family)